MNAIIEMNRKGHVNEIFLYCKIKMTSGRNVIYLHLLIGLLGSNKQCRAAKNLMPILKGAITIKSILYKILTKISTKEENLNFRKRYKTRF